LKIYSTDVKFIIKNRIFIVLIHGYVCRGVLMFNDMKGIILITAILCTLYFSGLCQKIEAPVLKKELVGKYKGHLQKGLAQGKGTAFGLDSYIGNFRKGYPMEKVSIPTMRGMFSEVLL